MKAYVNNKGKYEKLNLQAALAGTSDSGSSCRLGHSIQRISKKRKKIHFEGFWGLKKKN